MKFFTGCSGYMYFWWKGKFYPQDLPTSKYLDYYVSKFDTLEINSTFYRFPKKENLKRFFTQTPENFNIVIKMHRDITHYLRFSTEKNKKEECANVLNRFIELCVTFLQKKLKIFLIQLPPNYVFSEKSLDRIIYHLSPYFQYEFKFAIEFRDRNWWNEYAIQKIKEYGQIWVCPDGKKMPLEWHLTHDIGYLRFHGKKNNRHNYSKDELMEWLRLIKENPPKELYAFFNNDYNGYAPQNALLWKEMVSSFEWEI